MRTCQATLGMALPVAAALLLGGGCSRPVEGRLPLPKQAPKQQAEAKAVSLPASQPRKPVAAVEAGGGLFVEVTAELGLPERTTTWPDPQFLTPEITPGGVALFDYDLDGDLDIYQICHGPPARLPKAFRIPAPNRLFQQQSRGTFVEVANAAGLADPGYGHGTAVGDVDNDGDPDVYVTNYGPDAFFRNNGDGTFTEATSEAGFSGDRWSSAAAFFDYDRDGHLDLFVVHFARFDPPVVCRSQTSGTGGGEFDYCGPHTFPGVRDALYRNRGDGTFEEVAQAAGIAVAARGWGVLCVDLTGDGWPDIYVANDEEPNQLWVNQGDGTFFDEAVFRGAAFNGTGSAEASMGVALGDIDGDGRLDLFMTHLTNETNTFYCTAGGPEKAMYMDRSYACGMAAVDLPYTGWGCGLFDFDHDGDLDVAVANGRVSKGPVGPQANLGPQWNRYGEPNLLFRNDQGRFVNVSAEAGAFASRVEVTRALAFGDLDDDGDLDLVTNNVDNTLRVFRNRAPRPEHHWLLVRAAIGKRHAIGARLTLLAGAQRYIRLVLPSYSYLSSNDPRVHFGLGGTKEVEAIEVNWPDASRERFEVPGVDRVMEIRQGQGQPL